MKFSSYGQILKSSSIMGVVAGVTMILGMVRTKFAAILIGSAGVGLSANFNAIQGLMGAIAGLGIQSSAVRDIASAVARNNKREIGRTVLSLRRISLVTGSIGAGSMVLLSPIFSRWTFGSDEYRWDIAALGIVIFLANIQGGQMALIQGMRRMGDLAKVQLMGGVTGTLATVVFYFLFGIRGIVPAFVVMASLQLLISWWVAKKIEVPVVKMRWMESIGEANEMFRLGFAMMCTGLLGSSATYVINILITQQISMQAVGIYSAAFTLSGMLVNFVLSAMGADYYPRLTCVAEDAVAMNKLVNEQTEIGLLLAAPGLIATITLAPWLIHIFYSNEFISAVNLLQWIVLGCLGRVISWPIGYVILALNKRKLLLIAETSAQTLNILLAFIGMTLFGLVGVGIGFFILYVIHILAMYYIAKRVTNFYWMNGTKKLILIFSMLLITIFLAERILAPVPAIILGIVLTVAGATISLFGLVNRIGSAYQVFKIILRIPGMSKINDIYLKFLF